MHDLQQRLAQLSPAKRALLQKAMLAKGEANDDRTDIPKRAAAGPAPASFAQQRLWFLNQLEPDNPFYMIPAAFRLRGQVDSGVLEWAVNQVIQRHEALRTTFHVVGEQPVQQVSPSLTIPLERIDLRQIAEQERRAAAERHAVDVIRRPFSLSEGPLLRVALIHVADDEHWLVLAMHHIIADGWSMSIFCRELETFYQARLHQRPVTLAEPVLQYGDYAAWERTWLDGEAMTKQLAYWKEQLSGELPVLDLPTDRPRPPVMSYRGAKVTFRLPADLTEQLRRVCREEGATLYMTLLAAFQTLLQRYTNQEEILVGTPVAHRMRPEVEGIIGFFANTLVIRTRLDGAPSFRELLGRVREVCLGALAHQDLPFEELVRVLQPERDLSRSPLFQALFVLQNAADQPLRLTDTPAEPLTLDAGIGLFDLTLSMEERADGLHGMLQYSTDLFERETAQRMAGHFQRLLASIVADPDRSVAKLELMHEAERERLAGWNATARDYPLERPLHSFIADQVERTPDAIAVAFESESLTYRELNRRANQLAHRLRRHGVGPDVLVPICMERSLEMVVGLLGILKAGGAYVPVDPEYPPDRVAYMLSETRGPVLLTQQRLRASLPLGAAPEIICLDSDWDAIAEESDLAPDVHVGPEDLAYVIFTSGSTGKPKGVMLPHRGIVNRLLWMQEEYGLDESDRVMQKTPFSFDVSVWEFFWPLMTGARLVVAKPGGHRDSGYLVDLIRRESITTLHFVPSMLQVFLEEPELEQLSSLRRVICSGEALSFALQERFFSRIGAQLHNLYGPTEASVDVTYWACRRDEQRHVVPIGYPVANTQIHLLDERLQPVPVGVAGELHIGGVQVARGYLNRPELTAERFITDPFSSQPGAKLYKTGDLARRLPDGAIEYLGRLDHQVKIRGFRIELGEIEAVIARHPAVRECVVLAREDQPGDKRLVAYLVPEGGRPAAEAEVSRMLQAELPEFMVPAAFVTLPELPLTVNGKVDRKALPAPAVEERTRGYQPPQTPEEEGVAAIFAGLLGLEQVGRHESFFELGGHSLLATQAVSRLRSLFQVELPLRRLFEAPTVAGLARAIVAARSEKHGGALSPIAPSPGSQALSFAQERLWFMHQLEPESRHSYAIPLLLRLTGELDRGALEQALTALVHRHAALRATFPVVQGAPVQVTAPVVPVQLEWLAPGEVAAATARPFDLESGPLFRAALAQTGPTEHLLLLNMHHIISDGWSLQVLQRELAHLYEAFAAGASPSLPPLSLTYQDFAQWQRDWLQGDRLAAQAEYWTKRLAGAPPVLELPLDRPRPSVRSTDGAAERFTIPGALLQRLEALGRQEGATLFMVLLAAFKVLLSRSAGQEDVVVGSPVANRNREETEGLVGFFVNNLVLRTDLSGSPTFRELLGRVRSTAVGAYDHQDLPYEKLVELLQPERDLRINPLFQVLFDVESAPAEPQQAGGLTLERVDPDIVTAKFDLGMSLRRQADELVGCCSYRSDIFDASTIRRLASHFQRLLEGIANEPDRPIDSYDLLEDTERELILKTWNETSAHYPRNFCVHQLIGMQAELTPNQVAVIGGEESLTYGELDRQSNQLAHYLRGLGVGPESLVGICLERGPGLLVGLLGVLKAGGVYVPLDPLYPPERLKFMLADSGARVLVTESPLEHLLPETGATQVRLDMDWEAIASEPESTPKSGVTPANLAYVIYTSGSTGKPKGVQVEHRSLVNLLCAIQKWPGLSAQDCVAAVTSISFDIATVELYLPLMVGAQVVLVTRETAADGAALARLLAESGATMLQGTPATWQLLLDAGWTNEQRLKMLTGGEALSPKLAARLLATGGELWNLYGPTETTVYSTGHRVTESWGAIPIGRPIANTQIYLLDRRLNPVPVGVVGELYIGGDGVARGYLNRPELTEERFLPNPFKPGEGARIYRTGDLARYLPDGTIAYLGRVDHQVKIRGFRIELGEVEAALSLHPGVAQVAATTWEDGTGDRRLVAYVVARDGAPLQANELRSFLQTHLPTYMIPSIIATLAELPLTANGKVDRKALPAPVVVGSDNAAAPETPIEQVLASLWCDVLGIQDCSIHDSFFELGGHSLMATRLMRLVSETFQVDMPLRALFEQPTVSGFANQLLTTAGDRRTEVEQIAEYVLQLAGLTEEEASAALDEGPQSGLEGGDQHG